jgi:hypothetical protein
LAISIIKRFSLTGTNVPPTPSTITKSNFEDNNLKLFLILAILIFLFSALAAKCGEAGSLNTYGQTRRSDCAFEYPHNFKMQINIRVKTTAGLHPFLSYSLITFFP